MRDNKKAILIAMGANEVSVTGGPAATLRAALRAFPDYAMQVVHKSRFFQSDAWPDPSDPPFVNAVVCVETLLAPADLLRTLHDIEAQFGRIRRARNAPRTLDLDLIDYRGVVLHEPGGLQLPHPRAGDRAFVLAPLLDVAPDWTHPQTGESARQLLAAAEAAGSRARPLENDG